jgi:DNA-binding winged helix-turn-helix (wHTH) protein/Tol biopolymer transport system component
MVQSPKGCFVFGEFRLDGAERRLLRNEAPISLPPNILETLLLLVENAGHLVEKDEFMKRLWPGTFVGEDALARNISILRKTLGESSDSQSFIATVPTRGYRFVAPVQVVSESKLRAAEKQSSKETGLLAEIAAPKEEAKLQGQQEQSAPTLGSSVLISREPPVPRETPTLRSWPRWIAVVALVLGVGSVAGVVTFYLLLPTPTPRLLRIVPLTDSGVVHPNQKLLTDGPRLYFFERTQGRWVPKWMPTSGGTAVPIELPFLADLQDISPDGSELLVREFREQPGGDTWTVSTAGGSPHRLGTSNVDAAAYTRDGHAVLYSQGATVFACDHDGGNKRRIMALPGQVFGISVSPQGDRLRFYVGQGPDEGVVLWESRSDGANLHRVIKDSPRPRREWGGSWSPDGRWFTFSAPRGASAGRDVWLVGEPRMFHRQQTVIPLTSGPIDFSRPIFSHDGKRIFVVGGTRRGELLRYDLKKREFTQFLGGISAENIAFSPDKKSLIYVSYPDGGLWRARADGSEPLPLTNPPMRAGRAYWSPDGSKIAFEGSPKPGARWNVYVIPSTGAIPEQVAKDTDRGGLTWRSDSKSLVIGNSEEKSILQIVDLERHSVLGLPGTEGTGDPYLSPSGRYLVARTKEHALAMFDLTTQHEKVLATAGEDIGSPQWSADERYVYFNRFMGTAPAVYRVRIADDSMTRLMELKQFSAVGSWAAWSTIAPDGSLLLLRGLGGTDLYAIEWSER